MCVFLKPQPLRLAIDAMKANNRSILVIFWGPDFSNDKMHKTSNFPHSPMKIFVYVALCKHNCELLQCGYFFFSEGRRSGLARFDFS